MYIIEELHGEQIVGTFYKKELQQTNQSLELKKSSREKVINYKSNGKAT